MKKRLITVAMAVLLAVTFSFAFTACTNDNNNDENLTNDNQNYNDNEGDDDIMKNPIITIEMADGKIIKAELYPEKAPNTVNNFISLVASGFYDGLIFHRVIENFMIQGGDPAGIGTGGPGYNIKGEFVMNGFTQNDIKHERGVLSMARAMSYDSAGSQFFIMHKNASYLDGQYAAFGKVIEGMDVVDAIACVQTDMNDKPLTPQIMQKVTVETFGVEYDQPEKC